MLLSEAFEQYRQDRIIFANKSPKTLESYISTERSLLKFLSEDIPLKDLEFSHVRAWVNGMKKRHLSSGTIRGYVVCLRAVLGYMQILKIDCLNPKLMVVPDRIDPTPTFLTPKEVTHLIKVVSQTKHCSKANILRNKAIIALMYSSGVRAMELCSINRDDIQGNTFSVLGKGRKRRMCMIDSRAQRCLSAYLATRKDDNHALFLDNITGDRLKVNTLQSFFRRLNARSGLKKDIHGHTLRHSFANDLMRRGCHIYPLSRLMGHSNIATTQTYFSIYDPEIVEVYNKHHTV